MCTVLAGQNHPKLALSLYFTHIPADLIARAAQAFLGLATLTLSTPEDDQGCARVLIRNPYDQRSARVHMPHPSALPCLRHLTIGAMTSIDQNYLWKTAGPYFPQLISLTLVNLEHVYYGKGGIPMWCLPIGNNKTRSLQRLSLDTSLVAFLADMLSTCTPCIQTLAVTDVVGLARWDDVKDYATVCSWDRLQISQSFPVQHIDWLPLPAGDKQLTVEMQPQATVVWTLPVSDKVSTRIHQHNNNASHF